MASPSTTNDKRRIYAACRLIFSGKNADLRKTKSIRRFVLLHRSSLSPLLSELGEEKLVILLRELLEERIFKSESNARQAFPDLFRQPPAPVTAERKALEADAARSVTEMLKVAIASEEQPDEREKVDQTQAQPHVEARYETPQQDQQQASPICITTAETTPLSNSLPSLYPLYIPYQTQHTLLTTAQTCLEECCFDFATRWIPSVIEHHSWDCAAAAELTVWTRIFNERAATLPPGSLKLAGSSSLASFPDLLRTVTTLRHTAVHRLPTTAYGISRLLEAAAALADTLQDSRRTSQLEQLRFDFDIKVHALELSKTAIEDKAVRELEEIDRRRTELDKMECELKVRMLAEDRDNKALVGRLLEDSVKDIFQAGGSGDGGLKHPDTPETMASSGMPERCNEEEDEADLADLQLADEEVYYSSEEVGAWEIGWEDELSDADGDVNTSSREDMDADAMLYLPPELK